MWPIHIKTHDWRWMVSWRRVGNMPDTLQLKARGWGASEFVLRGISMAESVSEKAPGDAIRMATSVREMGEAQATQSVMKQEA